MFGRVRGTAPANPRITVHAPSEITPSTLPTNIVNKNGVLAPADAASPPAPRPKPRADSNPEAKRNGPTNIKSWRRRREYHPRVVRRNDHEVWIDRLNLNVWSLSHRNVFVRAKVTVLFRLTAHALNGIHNCGTVYENGVA